MDSSKCEIISLIIQGLVAFGTLLVAITAIWGEYLRHLLAGPKLEIILENPRGLIAGQGSNKRVILYQLKIINKRRWVVAKNVRILCTAISKKRPDASFTNEPMLFPIPLTWAPSEFTSVESTFASEDLCDLGNVVEGGGNFRLAARWWPNNYPGFLQANDAMRVRLCISGYNFKSKIPFDIEISWNGKWSDNLEEMAKHLIIKVVKSY